MPWRSVVRATGMPRPAKPARQTKYARRARPYGIRNGLCLDEPTGTRLRRGKLRAFLVCRAGFAGRGIPVARITERHMLASRPDPRRSLGSV